MLCRKLCGCGILLSCVIDLEWCLSVLRWAWVCCAVLYVLRRDVGACPAWAAESGGGGVELQRLL